MSAQRYQALNTQGQVLVVTSSVELIQGDVFLRWKDRACALVEDDLNLRDVVRDLLANPQVRVIVFDHAHKGREAFDAFWAGAPRPEWRIDDEHLQLVRQFVDLYDDDCVLKTNAQPFWPARILYPEETT